MASLTFTPVTALAGGNFNGDFNWNAPSNWTPPEIPAAGDDLTFASVAPANAYATVDDIGSLTMGTLSVDGFVTMFIGIGNSLTVADISNNQGVIQVDNGSTLTIEPGGNAAGRAYNLFHGTMIDPGSVTGSGAQFLMTSGTLEVGGTFVGSSFDIQSSPFADHNVLAFNAPPASTISNQISGVQAGDKIELGGITFDAANYSGTTLTLINSGSPIYSLTDLTLAPGTSPSTFLFSTDTSTGDHFIEFTPCFLAGTRIATPNGEVAVEALREGDLVTTLAGEAKRIRWIG